MNTPIVDFVKRYEKDIKTRFHMPGHKGKSFLGIEKYDITEVYGADDLGDAQGIIYESEKNASELFKTAHTYYSTQGSSSVICAMLSLVKGDKPIIAAARNVHKAFIHACALLDFDIEWIMPAADEGLLKCTVSPEDVEKLLAKSADKTAGVYLTSPDYLGNIQDVSKIAKVCKKYAVPLIVDNAHGAYLGFLENSLHPIRLGASLVCDSAHKTLPVLTGGAYLHISKDAPKEFTENARKCLSLFSSTSPSYLVLQSLDLCNAYLAEKFPSELKECILKTESVKKKIEQCGFCVEESELLKITVDALKSGYTGKELAEVLRKNGAEAEYCDEEFLVLMITPQNCDKDFERLKNIFSALKPKKAIEEKKIALPYPKKRMSVREAVIGKSEMIDIESACGRICAAPTVSCPPAVPIAVSGEEITKETAQMLLYYGIKKISVIKK